MRLLLLCLLTLTAGCLEAPATQTHAVDAAPPDEAPAAFTPTVVFADRLEATGVVAATEATFEVPEGARTLTLRADDPDDLAAGRFQLKLESPSGREWLVYGGYGYRSPVNAVFAGTTEETIETRALAGTWTLSANTDGHVDLGVLVELS